MWKDSYVYFLVHKVYNSPFIWDSNHVFHKNKLKRYNFWENTANEMNEEFEPVTPFEKATPCNAKASTFNYENAQPMIKIEVNEPLTPFMVMETYPPVSCIPTTSQQTQKRKQSFTFDSIAEKPPRKKNELMSLHSASETGETQHPHTKKDVMKETCTQTVVNPSVMVSKEITEAVTTSDTNKPMSVFAACIDEELSALDVDLKIVAKKKIFQIITDLQLQQLERNNMQK
ncbi:uncharacterized protein LOC119671154 [Teleopsis dalmanni]|uniref:uncharacterized protein LOC119671154 n=1 Tax=Teleopsis dalmanni TaxID=139649 RepID=UPI0018CEBE5C|nr:uncharacterized protein LOC119671154 [Teleopsis dalmanni]